MRMLQFLSLIFISEKSEKPHSDLPSNSSSTKTYPPSPEPDVPSNKPNSPTIKAFPPSSKSNDSFSKPNRTSIKVYPPSGKSSKPSRKTETSVKAYPPSTKQNARSRNSNVSSSISDVPSTKRNISSRKSDISSSKFDLPFEYEMYPGEDEEEDVKKPMFVESFPEEDGRTVKGSRSRSRSFGREEVDRDQNQHDSMRKTTTHPENPDDHLRVDVTCKYDDNDDRGLPPVLAHRLVEKDTPWISVGAVIGNFYRPQRSWGKVMFSQACVILFTGGFLPQCMLGYHPQDQTPPQEQTSQ